MSLRWCHVVPPFRFRHQAEATWRGEVRTCPRCHNTTQWTKMREFKQFTLFFIPVARWKRRQFEICGICGAAVAA